MSGGDEGHGDGDDAAATLFAPAGGWRVRLIDLSGGNAETDNVTEEIGGFPTIVDANAFARAYVRDSVEHCRQPEMTPRDVIGAWWAFGEDARVVDGGDAGWRSETELDGFGAHPAGPIERDWRALDPRRPGFGADDEDDDEDDDDDGDDDGAMPDDPAGGRA